MMTTNIAKNSLLLNVAVNGVSVSDAEMAACALIDHVRYMSREDEILARHDNDVAVRFAEPEQLAAWGVNVIALSDVLGAGLTADERTNHFACVPNPGLVGELKAHFAKLHGEDDAVLDDLDASESVTDALLTMLSQVEDQGDAAVIGDINETLAYCVQR